VSYAYVSLTHLLFSLEISFLIVKRLSGLRVIKVRGIKSAKINILPDVLEGIVKLKL
jgi:hypothetical protein